VNSNDLIKLLNRGCTGGLAAIREVVHLQPADGAGGKIFPPTYADGTYAFEKRMIDGTAVDTVLLDSVQSVANRLTGSGMPTPPTRSNVERLFISFRRPSGTLRLRLQANICMPGREIPAPGSSSISNGVAFMAKSREARRRAKCPDGTPDRLPSSPHMLSFAAIRTRSARHRAFIFRIT